jgi:integrase/recombinase XerD
VNEGVISTRSLKKRKKHEVRELPAQQHLLEELTGQADNQIFTVSRSTARRWTKELMKNAVITGVKAPPKGLRHSFAVHAVLNERPIVIIQKW